MQIFITGHKGMLGSAVFEEAKHRGHSVWASEIEHLHLESVVHPESVVVINCIGAIPQGKRQGHKMIYSNAVVPWILAEQCQKYGIKLIHISTDCVFGGFAKEPYNYSFPPDAKDLYGFTKAIGEKITALGATVIRTSFIGTRHGLLKWLSENKEGSVEGWMRATWTGSTVWEVAVGIFEMLEHIDNLKPIEHLSTVTVWSKHDVLARLNELLDFKVTIVPVYQPWINRALVPTFEIRDLNDKFVSTKLWEEWQK